MDKQVDKFINKTIVIPFVVYAFCFNTLYPEVGKPDSLKNTVELRRPLVRASIGNAVGIVAGAIVGGITAVGIWGIDAADNPDAGLGNVFIMGAGMYGGGMVGGATGTAIALRQHLSRGQRIKTFALSLAPHLVPSLIVVTGLGVNSQNRPSTLLKVSLTTSVPLSIILPTWYYNSLMKSREFESSRKNKNP